MCGPFGRVVGWDGPPTGPSRVVHHYTKTAYAARRLIWYWYVPAELMMPSKDADTKMS